MFTSWNQQHGEQREAGKQEQGQRHHLAAHKLKHNARHNVAGHLGQSGYSHIRVLVGQEVRTIQGCKTEESTIIWYS